MSNSKYVIASPAIILLFLSGYILYDYIGLFAINTKNLLIFFAALLGAVISAVSIFLYCTQDSQRLLLNDLARYIEGVYPSAYCIPKNSVLKEKRAYEYIKTNINTLIEKESKLRAEYEALNAFKNSIFYEILTPMNALFGYTKLLKETGLNKEQQELIETIEKSYKKLDERLNTVALEPKGQQRLLEVKKEPFNIVKEVETAVETFSVQADEKDIVLGLYIDPNIPHNLLGDGEKLSQVLTHLIDNSLLLSDHFSTIDIRLEKMESNGSIAIKFSVINQGAGLDAEELEHIRKVFLEMEIVEGTSNLNLKDLTICNRIVKRMGGTLQIESNRNVESTFSFILSFEKDNEEVDRILTPIFKGLKIGLALPHKDIRRQVDYNLQTYVEYLGGEFVIYSYDEINCDDESIALPHIMFIYHAYAKNEGELDKFSDLKCQSILITSGSLRSQIDIDKHHFYDIVYAPITMSKILRVLSQSNTQIYTNHRSTTIDVLVAEDNLISQTIIASILKNMNINVSVVSDGKEAYEMRKEHSCHLIFMDINMPVIDGYEATKMIRAYEKENHLKHTPIIAFSANTSRLDKKTYKKAGMDDLVGKPVHAQDIERVIHKYCKFE